MGEGHLTPSPWEPFPSTAGVPFLAQSRGGQGTSTLQLLCPSFPLTLHSIPAAHASFQWEHPGKELAKKSGSSPISPAHSVKISEKLPKHSCCGEHRKAVDQSAWGQHGPHGHCLPCCLPAGVHWPRPGLLEQPSASLVDQGLGMDVSCKA